MYIHVTVCCHVIHMYLNLIDMNVTVQEAPRNRQVDKKGILQ